MAAYMGETMSSISFSLRKPGVNGIRTKPVFTPFGWREVRLPCRVGNPRALRCVPNPVGDRYNVERRSFLTVEKGVL